MWSNDRCSLRSLDRNQSKLFRTVVQGSVESVLALNPIPVLVHVGGIDYEHERLGMKPVDQQVVNNATLAIGHATVLDLAIHQFGCVVCADPLNEVKRFRAFDHELAHVGHIEHSIPFTDGVVFFRQACVRYRHSVPSKRDHFRPERLVLSVERGEFQISRFHGGQLRRRKYNAPDGFVYLCSDMAYEIVTAPQAAQSFKEIIEAAQTVSLVGAENVRRTVLNRLQELSLNPLNQTRKAQFKGMPGDVRSVQVLEYRIYFLVQIERIVLLDCFLDVPVNS